MDINNLKLTKTIIDIVYPVGSYYETSDNNFNPNNEWFGTWELDSDGCVTVSKDNGTFNNLGSIVGSETRTLSVGNLPSHNHTFSGNYHEHAFSATTTTASLSGSLRTICYNGHAGTGIISNGTNSKDVQLTIKAGSGYGATTDRKSTRLNSSHS